MSIDRKTLAEWNAVKGVTVIDVRPMIASFKRAGQQLTKALARPEIQRAMRIEADRKHIVRVANREREIARGYLDARMDQMYADLGIARRAA